MESGASGRISAAGGRTVDQSRDDLPAHLAGREEGWNAPAASAGRAQTMPETLRNLRPPRATGGETDDRRASGGRRAAAAAGALGDRYDDGGESWRKQRLHPD